MYTAGRQKNSIFFAQNVLNFCLLGILNIKTFHRDKKMLKTFLFTGKYFSIVFHTFIKIYHILMNF